MTKTKDTRAPSSGEIFGRLLRAPLKLIPASTPVRIISGELRGRHWIPESAIHRCWMGWYERDKQRLVSNEVRRGSTFYDIGANVGFYTLLASALVGAGRVVAFEPLPRNLKYLRRHVELNKIDNVTVLEAAVSDRNQVLHFHAEETGFMGRLSDDDSELPVESVSLDALMGDGKIPPPDYIKMDVEGAELLALRGAEQVLRRRYPTIFLATHGHDVDRQCCEFLESLGYEIRRLSPSMPNGLGEVFAKHRSSQPASN